MRKQSARKQLWKIARKHFLGVRHTRHGGALARHPQICAGTVKQEEERKNKARKNESKKAGKRDRKKERKRERQKEGKKERTKERKKERKTERKKEIMKEKTKERKNRRKKTRYAYYIFICIL